MALKPVTLTKTVTTGGQRIQVNSTSIPVSWVRFQAKHSNTNDIYIGDNTVASTLYVAYVNVTENNFWEIRPNENARTTSSQLDLSDFYLDATTSGEIVFVSYLPRV